MKFLGKHHHLCAVIFLALLIGIAPTKSQVVYLSGTPTPWQIEVTNKFLEDHYLNSSALVSWDLENTQCHEVDHSVLQLCFKNEDIYLVSADPKALKTTFAYLVSEEAFEENLDEGKQMSKLKRPSTRRPL